MSKKKTKKEAARAKKRGRGRPPKPESERLGFQVNLRCNAALGERLDRHVGRLKAEVPAATWTRGAAMRHLLAYALDRIEAAEARRKRRG